MDKINIYVPEQTGNTLDRDAELFEIYKNDRLTINKNRFLSLLIQGYYKDYHDAEKTNFDKIRSSLKTRKLSSEEKQRIAEELYNKLLVPEIPSRKGHNPKRLSLKPTKETIPLIAQILEDLGDRDFISQYFCKLLVSYCEKPFSKREQIVFRKKYDDLKEYCEKGQSIAFRTIWDAKIYRVIPYKIVTGPEEMFNYLLCSEVDTDTKRQQPRAFHLNRIENISTTRNLGTIDETVLRYLEKMEKMSPQYVINDDEEACVRLTENGRILFSRIYYGRPTPSRIEKKEDGYYYYFDSSKYQLLLYFRKFGGEAEVLAPESLRRQIMDFYTNAFNNYNHQNKK